MLPFIFADLRMAPAGARAIGSALVDSGFAKTRIVLQQWNRNFRPSEMRLDGRLPDLFLISSMSLHTAACKEMIRDICRVEPACRPLVIAGGSLCIYEPWEVFYAEKGDIPLFQDREGSGTGTRRTEKKNVPFFPTADLAVTGEEYVLLNLLETLLSGRAGGEPLRQTFLRARDSGALDAIPGLVYSQTDPAGNVQGLVNTGVQRLAGNLDELPMPAAGYGILEPPSRRATLASRPLEAGEVARHSRISSLAITFGCKFSCEYCPIPAYNQRRLRGKSGARVREEISLLYSRYGLRYYFGTDDNFFADKDRSLEILESLAAAESNGVALRKVIRWGTEVTVHDTLAMREHLPLAHRAGVRALWLGVEDMTGALVRKGQTTDKTLEVFGLLRRQGICPMPMMMHHESQPLVSRGATGLLNQVRLLRRSGAVSLQVLMLTPSAGSRSYDRAFESGLVLRSAGGRPVLPRMYDGNYVIACGQGRPWRKQFNILAAYVYFYNPLRLIADLVRHRGRVGFKPAGMQIIGIWGLVHTIRRTLGWALRLMLGKIERYSAPPESPLPMQTCSTGILPVSESEKEQQQRQQK